jgi:hypothetical protein
MAFTYIICIFIDFTPLSLLIYSSQDGHISMAALTAFEGTKEFGQVTQAMVSFALSTLERITDPGLIATLIRGM